MVDQGARAGGGAATISTSTAWASAVGVGWKAVGHVLRRQVGVGDGHAEALEPPGDRLADAAEAQDPEALRRDLAAERDFGLGPAALAHMPVGLRDAPQERDDEADRQVGHVVGQHVGGVGDPEAARARACREVDLVEADAVDGDDLERRQPGGELVRKTEVAAGDHGPDRRSHGRRARHRARRPRTSGAR